MKTITTVSAFVVAMLSAALLWGAEQYGMATVQQGKLMILRGSQRLEMMPQHGARSIEVGDLLRVGPSSQAVLATREKSTLTLGANAVLTVNPWQRAQERGFMSSLFGRFRASVVGLSGRDEFNVKTATATIGVKGTDYDASTTANQDVWVAGTAGSTTLTGLEGLTQNVQAGFISVVVNGRPATVPASLPAAMLRIKEVLAAPAPTSTEAGQLPGAQEMIDAGILTPADVQQPGTGAAPGTGTDVDGGAAASTSLDNAVQSSSAKKGKLDIRFEK